jgi:hypothetical protein
MPMFIRGYLDVDHKLLFTPIEGLRADNPAFQFISGLVARDKQRRNIPPHQSYRYPYDETGIFIKITSRTKFYAIHRNKTTEVAKSAIAMLNATVVFTPWFLNAEDSVGIVLYATSITVEK